MSSRGRPGIPATSQGEVSSAHAPTMLLLGVVALLLLCLAKYGATCLRGQCGGRLGSQGAGTSAAAWQGGATTIAALAGEQWRVQDAGPLCLSTC